ncbi:MAG TPA: Calx-beta domain-containing protein [Pyrinomonadaceae bacterium]|nr:Calx-beta domain-containing protein [Pyrinomonadaceae bacterium]
MHFRFTSAGRSASTFAFAALLTLAFSLTANAQYFKLSGSFTYHNIPSRPGYQVFDISPDGKMGVALRTHRDMNAPVITTFHPLFGDQFDTKTFGFGPLEVRMAKVGDKLRAVVLTSQGGPRRIYLFDISATGQLTEIGFTDLTTSVGDAGTNMVLSGQAGLGWIGVDTNASADDELVCFSLETGAVVKRSTLVGRADSLILNEGPNRRNIAYRSSSTFKLVNVLDSANPVETAGVALTRNDESSAHGMSDEAAFSADGRYVFFINNFHNFAAIDLNTKQIVATLASSFAFVRIESFEDSQRRLLAVLSEPAGTGRTIELLLIDATNPSQLTILKNISPAPAEHFKFSNDGTRLFAASPSRLVAFNLPDFTTIWEQPTPNNPIHSNGLRVYGPNDEIVGAWWFSDGTGDGALIGAFPSTALPTVTLSDSVTVNETAGGVNATFTVSLSAPTTHRITVNYTTVDDTAKQDHDYTSTSGALAIQPGTTSGNVSIPILDDVLDEANETLTFKIAPNFGNTSIEKTVTIVDNDPPPSITIGDSAPVAELDSFPGLLASFPVTLSAPSGQTIVVTYASATNTAAVNDYLVVFGTVTFFPGETVHEIVVPIIPDTYAEDDETFFINLNKPANAGVVDGQGVGKILDDDAPLLATEQNSQRAIAFDAVTFVRDPFSITNPAYFGTDTRTRVAIFSNNLEVSPGLQVTVQAVDAQQVVHQLPVESVTAMPGFLMGRNLPILTQIVVRLPEGITTAGDWQISITARGRTSNKVLVGVKP